MSLRRMIKRTAEAFLDLVSGPLKPVTPKNLRRFTDRFAALPIMDAASVTGSQQTWYEFVNNVRQHGATDELQRFMRWPIIQRTMFVSWAAWLKPELQRLKSLPDWKERWHPAIRETTLGSPVRYFGLLDSSGNAIHHAYAISLIEQHLGAAPRDIAFALEFGGGYGSFARVFHNLGFRGLYTIFDFPHLSLLQQFYLETLGLPRAETRGETGVLYVTDVAEIENPPLPTQGKSLFVATWSLSEAPLPIRAPFEALFEKFDFVYIAFQHHFEENDNLSYFHEIAAKMPHHHITFHRLSHITESSVFLARRR